MDPGDYRARLLAALEENGRQTTDALIDAVGEEQGLGYEETKAALDGLADADLVVWEAGGTDHLWRISPHGRDFLSRAHG